MRKKVFSIIMSLLMVITMIPLFAVDSHATEPIDYFYIKNESNSPLTVGFSSEPVFYFDDFNLQYSTDPTDSSGWTDLTIKPNPYNFVTQLPNNGDKVYFRCNDSSIYNHRKLPSFAEEAYIFFDISGGSHSVGGDIRTLIADPALTSLEGITNIGSYSFFRLFYNDSDLISYDGDLLFSSADDNAFKEMFRSCINLKRAPNMYMQTLGSNACEGMFYKCTSLRYIPELPAKNVRAFAYYNMFFGCTQFKLSEEKPSSCYTLFKIPSNGHMETTGINFSLEMFGETSGDGTPAANLLYYVEDSRNVHSFEYSWKDEDKHIKICSACGSVIEENHSFGEPLVSNGLKVSECIHCGFKHIEAAPSTGGGSTILPESTVEELDKLKNEVEELKEEIEFIKTAPALSSIKIKPKKKRINLTLEKVKGATHYQICVKRKGKKSKTIEFSAENNTKTIRHLKSGKKYSIKVRAVKKKDKSVTCGKWSKTKYVRVK